MKQIILLLMLLASAEVFSQCVYCTTVEEAEKDTLLVRSLDLSANYLTELPPELNKFRNLEHLYLLKIK